MNKSKHLIGQPCINDLLRLPAGSIGYYKIINYSNSQAMRAIKQKEISCGAKASLRKMLMTDPISLTTYEMLQITVIKQGNPLQKRGRKLGGKNK